MRVPLDPNVYVSYLLASPTSRSPIVRILEAAFAGTFALILPLDSVDEVERVVRSNPYLTARVAPGDIERLVGALAAVAESVPRLTGAAPRLVRDPSDDYLVAQAIQARVDIVVSGDKDLAALGEYREVRFLNPTAFALSLAL